jgi:hypothetical protein
MLDLLFVLFFVPRFGSGIRSIFYLLLGISLMGMIIMEIVSSYFKKGKTKKKTIVKPIYKVIYSLFLIGLILVVVVRDNLESAILIDIINFYFWYVLGLSSAIYIFDFFENHSTLH